MKNKKKVISILVASLVLVLTLTIFLGFNQSSVLASTYKQELQTLEESFKSANTLEDKVKIIDQIKDKHITYTNDSSFFKNFGEYKKLESTFSTQIESLTQTIEEDYITIFKDIKIIHDDKPNKEDLSKAVDSLNSLLTTLQSDTVLSETSLNQLKTDIDHEINTYKTSIKEIETQEETARLEEERKLAAARAEAEAKAKSEKEKTQSKPNSSTNKPSTGGSTNSGNNSSNNKPSTGGGSTSSKPTWKNSKPDYGVISPKGCPITQKWWDSPGDVKKGYVDSCGNSWDGNWNFIENINDWLDQG